MEQHVQEDSTKDVTHSPGSERMSVVSKFHQQWRRLLQLMWLNL